MYRVIVLIGIMMVSLAANAQQEFTFERSDRMQFTPLAVVHPATMTHDWNPQLQNLEQAFPGGDSYRSFLLRQKEQLKTLDKSNNKAAGLVNLGDAEDPLVMDGFEANEWDGSVPNDNDVAVSNGSWLISVVNSNIIFYDTNLDSLMFDISLESFTDSLNLPANKFDPKVIYDPIDDRFIMVMLSGNTDSTSNSVVAFSSSNSPMDPWFIYALPGDPNNQGYWTDYPIIAATQEEFFLTVNLLDDSITDTVSSDRWKFIFAESVVWQMNKESGYTGDTLEVELVTNVRFNNQPIRNLFPVQGGATLYGPNMYLLSNRNFDMINDTIFFLEITGTLDDPNTTLEIDFLIADIPYGLAPDGEQAQNQSLQTNDSRVLGGFLENNQIHFVSNTRNPDSLRSAIYHGIINNVSNNPVLTAGIIGQNELDFGYPNISFTGQGPFDEQALITFNHTSIDSFAGVSAVYYNAFTGYSNRITLKEGEDYVNVLSGTNERWGDYSGSQPVYNDPGKVWVAGFFGVRRQPPGGGFLSRFNLTWVAKLASPDSTNTVSSVGVTDNKAARTKTYPNPTNDQFVTEFELAESQWIDISLYDLNGKLVKTFIQDKAKKGTNRFSFSIDPLSPGVYFLNIAAKEGIIASERVVKQ